MVVSSSVTPYVGSVLTAGHPQSNPFTSVHLRPAHTSERIGSNTSPTGTVGPGLSSHILVSIDMSTPMAKLTTQGRRTSAVYPQPEDLTGEMPIMSLPVQLRTCSQMPLSRRTSLYVAQCTPMRCHCATWYLPRRTTETIVMLPSKRPQS